jgi:CO/xanthine dehydrogenase FAD-binding subunit
VIIWLSRLRQAVTNRGQLDDFFLLPGMTPHREHSLEPGEMITAVTIPASPAVRQYKEMAKPYAGKIWFRPAA